MALLGLLLSPYTLVVIALLSYLLPYLRNRALLYVPGPWLAAISNLWLMSHARRGRRYVAVDAAHKKYGKVVRIQPSHVSLADASAIPVVYGHGNGTLKSDFYDAFMAGTMRSIFTTRDRAEHARKRKIVSHTFSAKSIGQFEQYMHHNLATLIKQWDKFSDLAHGKFAKIDALQWFNYTAFDIIGDLAFGGSFGMLERGQDTAETYATPGGKPTYVPAVDILNQRGVANCTVGCYPAIKSYAKYIPDPGLSGGVQAGQQFAGMAIARVDQRLANPHTERVDILARLIEGKDDQGEKLGRAELIAEATTQLVAGSDTTSNSACAIFYHTMQAPHVVRKLQAELDSAIPSGVDIPDFETLKHLPYLNAVINEGMRIHSTASIGAPRIIPPGPGVDVLGHHFPPGTTLSVPTYTVHRSKEIWGPDAEDFVPERWGKVTDVQRDAFIPFSTGPRACVGRNVAEMELVLTLGTIFHRYDFELYQGDLSYIEDFLRKPLECQAGLKRRTPSRS